MKPPRGSVRITVEPAAVSDGPFVRRDRHTAVCSNCGWTYTNVVKSDVQMQKSWHRCPEVAAS